jgi:GNAT superfamily N-acetyltransferase
MASFEELQGLFANAYTTKRLVFRPFEDNSEADKEFSHQLLSDPLNNALASIGLFSMVNRKKADELIKDLPLMIHMLICLKPEEAAARAAAKPAKEGDAAAESKSEPAAPAGLIPIGRIALSNWSKDPNRAHVRCTELGIQLKEGYWNQGYGSEAVNWALDYAFRFAGVHKVELGTASYNVRAAAVYEKAGFKLEGRKRHGIFALNTWFDVLLFGILEDEWRAIRGIK